MRENFHKRLVAVKTADAINAIKGVLVSADAKLLVASSLAMRRLARMLS